MPDETVTIRSVCCGTYTLEFRKPLVIPVEKCEDGTLVAGDATTLVAGYGQDIIQLTQSIHDDVRCLWGNYAEASDKDLTPAAIKLKRRLRRAIIKREILED